MRKPASSVSPIPSMALSPCWDWPEFWTQVHAWMKEQGYAHSTAKLYRQILRNFARVAAVPPASVTRATVDAYLQRLGRGHCSAHWAAINLSTLRTVFDKVFGLGLLDRHTGPRHPDHLPCILNPSEAIALLAAATTLRDRLLISLLYGCGLHVGELQQLRWRDLADGEVHAPGNLILLPRILRLPDALRPLVEAATACCSPGDLVFPGHRTDRPLTARRIQHIVHTAAETAGILKPTTPMTLRHSYAVHCLEANTNIRELQTALGHRLVTTTLRYTRCMLPAGIRSPLDSTASPPQTGTEADPIAALAGTDLTTVSRLAALATTASEFVSTLRSQLGPRLFAFRKSSSDPP